MSLYNVYPATSFQRLEFRVSIMYPFVSVWFSTFASGVPYIAFIAAGCVAIVILYFDIKMTGFVDVNSNATIVSRTIKDNIHMYETTQNGSSRTDKVQYIHIFPNNRYNQIFRLTEAQLLCYIGRGCCVYV